MKEGTTDNWYQDNINKFSTLSAKLSQKSNEFSTWRVLVFLLYVTLVITAINYQHLAIFIGVTLIFGVLFPTLVKLNNRVKAQKVHYDLLVEFNLNELKRLSLDLKCFEEGNQYNDPKHPYCSDLDLFGSHSLFQWLNRCVTHQGELLLANSLLTLSQKSEILDRQTAVKEISLSGDWCQNFLVSGLVYKGHNRNIDHFLQWVENENEYPKWFIPAICVLPLLAVGLTAAFFLGYVSELTGLSGLIVNGAILYRVAPLAQNVYEQTHQSINNLKAFEAMILKIEQSNFQSPLLQKLRKPIVDKQERASNTIKELKQILSKVEVRQNKIYWIFNAYLLLDLIWLIQAERWKVRHKAHVRQWFMSIAQHELLASLALNARGQENIHFPSISNDPYIFESKGLGHPLISSSERVTNDFKIQAQGTVIVLTGSNMSGKSTFLRTIGVNTVLAGIGACVCAQTLQIGRFSLFTSMRTTDSLEQHVSSFYAELERISQLIQWLQQGNPTLFLLDELLKGTNSKDRNRGSTALIRQLSKGSAFGLVSTHDLLLGELAQQHQEILNFSFNSKIKAGQLHFDYKLSEGLCNSFNASELMSQIGININQ